MLHRSPQTHTPNVNTPQHQDPKLLICFFLCFITLENAKSKKYYYRGEKKKKKLSGDSKYTTRKICKNHFLKLEGRSHIALNVMEREVTKT